MDEKVREIEKRLQNRYSEVPDRFLWPLMDIQYLLSHIEKLEGKVKELRGGIEGLLRRVNAVTAPHRHGNPIPKSALNELANRQLEIEKLIEGD